MSNHAQKRIKLHNNEELSEVRLNLLYIGFRKHLYTSAQNSILVPEILQDILIEHCSSDAHLAAVQVLPHGLGGQVEPHQELGHVGDLLVVRARVVHSEGGAVQDRDLDMLLG